MINQRFLKEREAAFQELLASAARLQQLVPDTVLVGGTAAILHAGHRFSFDHDHVVTDLRDRFDTVLDALEREGEWVTNRTAYGKLIPGSLGGIETGIRQLIRKTPLETEQFRFFDGVTIRIPTIEETLRIKAFLIVKRNQTRDYIDVAALADRYSLTRAAQVLNSIDLYYADQAPEEKTVAAQLVAQLVTPCPKDSRTTKYLHDYKGLAARWQKWSQVIEVCQQLADAMLLRSIDHS